MMHLQKVIVACIVYSYCGFDFILCSLFRPRQETLCFSKTRRFFRQFNKTDFGIDLDFRGDFICSISHLFSLFIVDLEYYEL